MVDCEDWGIFSYLAGTTGQDSRIAKMHRQIQAKKTIAKDRGGADKNNMLPHPKEPATKLQEQVTLAIDQGDFHVAVMLQNRLSTKPTRTSLSQLA
jgi:hypothetical protein